MKIEANNPHLKSFIEIPADHHFSIQNLPFGIFSSNNNSDKRVGIALGDFVIDLDALNQANLFVDLNLPSKLFQQSYLNFLMELGRLKIREIRNTISKLFCSDNPAIRDNTQLRSKILISIENVTLHLPVKINGYTDFYSSKQHTENVGKMFRDKSNPLPPNWLHLPIGYDGRASSVVVSGTDFHRPQGQILSGDGAPIFSPSRELDFEIEMGFFVGKSSEFGKSISMADAPDHIFGMVILNDWSARDIQKWEYAPLGPFLSKNFCTSISPWVVTLDALEPFRVASPSQDAVKPLPYLLRSENWGMDIHLEMSIQAKSMSQSTVISRTNYDLMYWDMCQQLAHHSVNGCPMFVGDLLGSGAISGNDPKSYGSLLELTWHGEHPIQLTDKISRVFLEDEDTVTLSGYCQGEGYRVGFGEVAGKVLPAHVRG